MGKSKYSDLRASVIRIVYSVHFIPAFPLQREFFAFISTLCGTAKMEIQYRTALAFPLVETRFSTGLACDFARASSCCESVSPCGTLGRDLGF